MKICKECQRTEPEVHFSGRSALCNKCCGILRKDQRLEYQRRDYVKTKLYTKQSENRIAKPEKAILADCRSSDRKKGFQNDLDISFILETIKNGCIYCGNNSIRITLDRIDNSIGHLKSNVLPACIRCNYIKGSMPHKAWLHIASKIKEAYELGLFEDWRTKPFNVKDRSVTVTEFSSPGEWN